MSRSKRWLSVAGSLLIIGSVVLSACQQAAPAAAKKLEFFSWWTAGGEAEGLNGMYEVYKAQNPGVEIVNATVGGDPPDSFQVHAGLEVQKYSPEQYLEPLDSVYTSEGWDKVFPKDLLTLLQYQGHYWSVPVNIHRSNVMWYNKQVLADNGIQPPKTFDEFFAAADKLKAKGIVPLVMGTKDGWEAGHVFEGVLAGTLGADGYRGLWTGATPWTDAKVTQALENFKKMLSYINEDHAALTWDGAGQSLIDGTGAMMIMGDWTAGWFASKKYAAYGWAPPPGTTGIFVALSDSFALPKGAKNRDSAIAWLKVSGSKAGQEAFNPKKGSICARTDCSNDAFKSVPETYEYLTSAAQDWTKDSIVPSVVHGAASFESWATEYKDVITLFVKSGDVAATQAALQKACVTAGVCK